MHHSPPSDTSACSRRWHLFAITLLFLLVSLPLLSQLAGYRGDERYYSDAVMQMHATGDYLTPRYGDGQLRFNKPILSYWVIAASHLTLGINYLSTRLPFLLAGCATILLLAAIARRIAPRERFAPLLTAALLISNVHVLNASIRTTPDMLQCAFVALSLLGLVRILFGADSESESARRFSRYLFWTGLGLVCATKGGLAFILLLLPVIFWPWRSSKIFPGEKVLTRAKRIIDPLPILLAALIAFFWFMLIYHKYGSSSLEKFFDDQVGTRFTGTKLYLLENAFGYPLAFLWDLFPWLLLAVFLAWGRRADVRGFIGQYAEPLRLALLWLVILLLTFTLGNIFRSRYLLPAYPLAVPLLAAFLSRMLTTDSTPRPSWIAMFTRIVALGIAAGGVVILASAWFFFPSLLLALGGGVLVVVGMLAFVLQGFASRRSPNHASLAAVVILAAMILLAARTSDLFIQNAFFSSPVYELNRELAILTTTDTRVAALAINRANYDNHATQLRIISAGRLQIDEPASRMPVVANIVFLPTEAVATHLPPGFQVVGEVRGSVVLKPKYFFWLLSGKTWADVRRETSLRYTIAVRAPRSASSTAPGSGAATQR